MSFVQKGKSSAPPSAADGAFHLPAVRDLVQHGRLDELLLSAIRDMISKAAAYDLRDLDALVPLEVAKRISGLGKTSIYAGVRAGTFPAPYKPGGGATRWSYAELIQWRLALKPVR
jgi:prophage regulatory protein